MMSRAQAYLARIQSILDHPGNRGSRAAALLRTVRWRTQLLVSPEPWAIPVFGGMRYLADDMDVSRSIVYYGPWFEYDEMHFVSEYLRPDDSILDVGANAGIYTLMAAAIVGAKGRIDAIEPLPATFERLERNIRLNALEGLVHGHNVAVGETEGTVVMTTARDSTNHVVTAGAGVDVPCIRLENLLNERTYSFAKMDVEGMELPALRGTGAASQQGNPPLWMIEVNGALHRYGHSVEDVVAWASGSGYEIATYRHATRELSVTNQPWDNVFMIHRTAWGRVHDRVPGLKVLRPVVGRNDA